MQREEDEILGKAYDARLVRRLLTYLAPYRAALVLALALLGALALLEQAGPLLFKIAIDEHIARGDFAGLGPVAALYLVVLLGAFALRYGQTYLLNRTGQRAMQDLRNQLFRHLQGLSLAYFDRNPVGRLMTRITNDVESLNELLTSGALSIFTDCVTVVVIAVALLWLDWRLALITFAALPVLIVLTNVIRRGMRDSFRAIRIRLARLNAHVAESLAGMSVIQLFTREQRNFAGFEALNRDYTQASLRSVFYFALFQPIVGTLAAVTLALLLWHGGGQVAAGALTIGTLVAFVQYVERLFLPIRDLAEKYNILQQAMASSERIFQLLDERPEVRDPARPVKLERFQGEIEFRNVWFAYEPDNWVLRDVSFKIAPGESVAIVGATGAGKTSIISLISRCYDVQRGQVLVDGVDVRDLAQRDLRRHVGVVLQDPFLFAGTIARNIRLLADEISDEQVRAAARYVGADRFIERLPCGYEEPVRERGAGLSVGQKQLIAFARAIAFNPQILLVLDEATSSVDTETEHLIQEALAKLLRGRTSIVIAHRLSTIRQVDRILVLHKGRLVEAGTHEELLARNGVYARLYELQYRDQEPEARAEGATRTGHSAPRPTAHP